jgi:hypothetical protein
MVYRMFVEAVRVIIEAVRKIIEAVRLFVEAVRVTEEAVRVLLKATAKIFSSYLTPHISLPVKVAQQHNAPSSFW